jgi:Fic family protein
MRRLAYIYQQKDWPSFKWDAESIQLLLGKVRHSQGKLYGQMEALGFELRSEAFLSTLTRDVITTTEIEGEYLDSDQVRSSIARRLGMDIAGLVRSDAKVEGVVSMMHDATKNYQYDLTKERLLGWHAALFPTGYSGMHKITVGDWRQPAGGPMQVVSGAMGKERIHFEAPEAEVLEFEMERFLDWFNGDNLMDPVIKAAVSHFWFVTIHPFDDGNGRIARAIADMQLARSEDSSFRFYSMSAQIRKERNDYYTLLENSQKGGLDITNWLHWFLSCLSRALLSSEESFSVIKNKARFWNENANAHFNERQKVMLNKLLDGFEGNLTSSKWAKIAKCSSDTALRDIQDLVSRKILRKNDGGGRSTGYSIC